MQTRRVAMATDDNYVFPFIVTLLSAKQSTKLDFEVILAHVEGELSQKSIAFIETCCKKIGVRLITRRIDVPFSLPMAESSHISKTSWARILLMLKEEDEFVWLDSDLLMLPGWDRLLSEKIDGAGYGIAAVKETQDLGNQDNRAVVAAGESYFNAGVLIVDPSKLREELGSSLLVAIDEYKQHGFKWVDQDVLNYCTRGDVGILEPTFNIRRFDPASPKSGFVIHFAGNMKPWHALTRFYEFFNKDVRGWNRVARRLAKQNRFSKLEKQEISRLRFQAATRNGQDIDGLDGWRCLAVKTIRLFFA